MFFVEIHFFSHQYVFEILSLKYIFCQSLVFNDLFTQYNTYLKILYLYFSLNPLICIYVDQIKLRT